MDNGTYICLLARIEALKSEREGMIAENKQREVCGESMAYIDSDFQENANQLNLLSRF